MSKLILWIYNLGLGWAINRPRVGGPPISVDCGSIQEKSSNLKLPPTYPNLNRNLRLILLKDMASAKHRQP